jgi:hypothetical protein
LIIITIFIKILEVRWEEFMYKISGTGMGGDFINITRE